MKMTKDVSIVFVVGIVGPEQSWTQGTCEMFHVVLLVCTRAKLGEVNDREPYVLQAVI